MLLLTLGLRPRVERLDVGLEVVRLRERLRRRRVVLLLVLRDPALERSLRPGSLRSRRGRSRERRHDGSADQRLSGRTGMNGESGCHDGSFSFGSGLASGGSGFGGLAFGGSTFTVF